MMQPTSHGIVRVLLLSTFSLATAACGSSGTGSASAANCQSACSKCSGGDLCADCAATADRYRGEYKNALFPCVQGAASCTSTTWASCGAEAAAKAPRRPADDSFRSACLSKRSTCEAEGASFADDYCLGTSLLSEASLEKANDCLAKPCSEASNCLRDVFKGGSVTTGAGGASGGSGGTGNASGGTSGACAVENESGCSTTGGTAKPCCGGLLCCQGVPYDAMGECHATCDLNAAEFGRGSSDRVIATVDASGVALASIQALHARMERLTRENAELRTRLRRLEAAVRGR
jgi:hypothetical protein